MEGEAVKRIVDLAQGVVGVDVEGKTYSAAPLKRVYSDPRPEPLMIQSLSGLVDYLKANVDGLVLSDLMIHVVNHEMVRLVTKVHGEENRRHSVLQASRDGAEFEFGRWIPQEKFIIAVRSGFEHTNDMDLILHHTAKIDTDSAIVTQDDGVTQKVNIRKGVSGALTEAKEMKPNVLLRPHRTFAEVEQPESEFLFRMRGGEGARVECALFEADNSAWKSEARKLIASYLEKTGVAIIA